MLLNFDTRPVTKVTGYEQTSFALQSPPAWTP
jgi:hypothetical protein